MEITRYLEEYKKHDPKEFYDWLAKGKPMEVRFLSDRFGNKFSNYVLIKTLAKELGLDYRFTSLYINSYKDLKTILLYRINSWPLTRIYNIFISVNPKRKVNTLSKNGLVYKSFYGGIAGISHIQTLLCDIEHIGERKGNATESMLEECIQGAKYLVKILELEDYYINISGNGVHLWIAMNPAIELPIPSSKEITIKGKKILKYNLKEELINGWIKTYNKYIEKLNKELKNYNPKLKVDEGAKDISRIARPPGSWNVKKNKLQRAVGTVFKERKLNKDINLKFTSVKPNISKNVKEFKQFKVKSKNYRYTALTIKDCPLAKLLTSNLLPSTLSRNHYLEQSFARILRDNDISVTEIQELIEKIDYTQQKTIQVDPDYLDDDEPFNPETVNAYCYACKLPFIYPIMEDVPDITEGYITDEHYNNLNSYSDKTVEKMSVSDKNIKTPKTYYELKMLIRYLIDNYTRSECFFTVKRLTSKSEKYLKITKILVILMNKTRKKYDDDFLEDKH